jgi:hypothetical protein
LTRRAAARAALLATAVAALVLALGPPRLVWENDGLRMDHPPRRAAAAFAGATALAVAPLGLRRRYRALGAAAALAALTLGAERLAWQVEVVEKGVSARGLRGATRVSWGEVEAVEPTAGGIRVRAADGRAVTLETGGIRPADRLRLERTVSRRVREASR